MRTREPHYFVYIFGEQPDGNLEIGIAGDLHQFTSDKTSGKPGISTAPEKLVYYEHYQQENEAQDREQQLKEESREETIQLIESMNPNWLDLSDTLDD